MTGTASFGGIEAFGRLAAQGGGSTSLYKASHSYTSFRF